MIVGWPGVGGETLFGGLFIAGLWHWKAMSNREPKLARRGEGEDARPVGLAANGLQIGKLAICKLVQAPYLPHRQATSVWQQVDTHAEVAEKAAHAATVAKRVGERFAQVLVDDLKRLYRVEKTQNGVAAGREARSRAADLVNLERTQFHGHLLSSKTTRHCEVCP